VVRLDNGRCMVQTLDFFTPIVDDPYQFGAISAANSLSDVYAMGAVPLSALNIVCWPTGALPEEVLGLILQGGADKVAEAGALLIGGHSVKDDQLMYGLSVLGEVQERHLWTNAGAEPGDKLLLSKPLGTGIMSTALKRDQVDLGQMEPVFQSMARLNRSAAEAARSLQVHACTDITGFGLVGHGWEMARASGVTLCFDAPSIPRFDGALDLAAAGHLTRGEKVNRSYVGEALIWGEVSTALQSVIVDPQTSGGLLFAMPARDAARLVATGEATEVGEVREGPASVVVA